MDFWLPQIVVRPAESKKLDASAMLYLFVCQCTFTLF